MGSVEDTISGVFSGYEFTFTAETGDIKNYPDRQYCFFTLLEKKNGETIAKADAVIWKSHHFLISRFEGATGKRFEKNMQILFRAEVTFHPVFGLRLRITHIDETYTLGQIEQERRAVLHKLVTQHAEWVSFREGEYYSANRRLALPPVIKRIALITAHDSDGLRDFMHELESNLYGYRFTVRPFLTRVQGKGAEKEIEAALNRVAAQANDFDVAVLVRGGGSGLDLGPFDTLEPGLAIASFPIPVITGIGHERNVSVADLMSHTKVKTPTKAAAFIVEHNADFEAGVEDLGRRIKEGGQRLVRNAQNKMEKIELNLTAGARHFLLSENHRLNSLEQLVKSRDPDLILSLGYALVRKKGKLITAAEKISSGEHIEIQWKDRRASAEITEVQNTESTT